MKYSLIRCSYLGDRIRGPVFRKRNVTRYDMGDYICIANNGVPPAKSKTISLSVNCEFKLHH